MLIIQNNKKRRASDYLAMADILNYGLDATCLKNCETCNHSSVCNEVKSAIDYSYKLYEEKRSGLHHK